MSSSRESLAPEFHSHPPAHPIPERGIPKVPIDARLRFQRTLEHEGIAELQNETIVPAFEKRDFLPGVDIAMTMQQKPNRAGKPNEDAGIFDQRTGLVLVADGLGSGGGNPDEASRSAVVSMRDTIRKYWDTIVNDAERNYPIGRLMEKLTANQKLRESPEEIPFYDERRDFDWALEQDQSGDMVRKAALLLLATLYANDEVRHTKAKTTIAGGLLHQTPDGRLFLIGVSFGDSVVLERHGQVNEEDSLLRYLLQKNLINEERVNELRKDPEQTFVLGRKERNYEALRRTMVNALGDESNDATPDIFFHEITSDCILASDGVADRVENKKTREPDTERLFGLRAGRDLKGWTDSIRVTAMQAKDADKPPDDVVTIVVHKRQTLS